MPRQPREPWPPHRLPTPQMWRNHWEDVFDAKMDAFRERYGVLGAISTGPVTSAEMAINNGGGNDDG